MLRLSTSALRIGTRAGHRIFPVSLNLYFVVLIAAVTVYYLFLLSNGTFQILAQELLDKVFDNILVHLLRGEFTVDRGAIDYEAVTRNGRSYTYFGVFPAMLRLLAMPFVDIAQAELARLSCLVAVVIFVVLQLRMLLITHYSLPAGSLGPRSLPGDGCSDSAQRSAALHLGFGLGLSRADPLGGGSRCRV